ncbi:hypothetical protein [Paenarthrobacter sp. NCHU4564]|uniref:hypothetical protein n=1 Tax=Paenarthrobacter sp. NCHU4564 TaxID=3451353 RepID=UPI003F9836A1
MRGTNCFSKKTNRKKVLLAGLGFVLALALMTPVPATAATHEATSPGESRAKASNEGTAYLSSSMETIQGQKVIRLSAIRAKFDIASDGTLLARDARGNVLERTSAKASVAGVDYTLSFKLSSNRKQVDVYFQPANGASPEVPTLRINQGCAFNNLLWGLCTGALTGAGAGIPGMFIGGLTGAIFSGIQSATSC